MNVPSVYVTQEALIFTALQPITGLRQELSPFAKPFSILYCAASDGRPGIIEGAPAALLLEVGTRVDFEPGIEIMVHGGHMAFGYSPHFDSDTVLGSGPDGVIVIQPPRNEMTVYPPGSTLTVGGNDETVSYTRPGDLKPVAAPQPGCTVTLISNDGSSRVLHYSADCRNVASSKPWLGH